MAVSGIDINVASWLTDPRQIEIFGIKKSKKILNAI
jgi:hypothetical protein